MTNKEDKNFIQHFINVGAGTVINLLLGLVSTPLITRIVDPTEYGKLSIFNAYADIALALVFIGLDKGLIRFFYNSDKLKDQRSLLKLCFYVPTLAALISSFIFVGLFKLNIIRVSFDFYVIVLLCIYVLICIWNRLSLLLLRLTYKTKEYTFVTVVQKIVYVLIIVIFALAIKKYYLLMLILSLMMSTFVGGIVSTIYSREYWKLGTVKIPNRRNEIFKYSTPFILYSGMDALTSSMDKLSIYAFLSDYETGIYTSALSLVAIVLTVRIIFETIWTPMQTESFVKNPDDKSFIQKGNRYLTIILFFIGINVIMFKELLCFLLGSQYRGAAPIIPFLLLGNILFAISDTCTSGIDYSKKSYLHALIGFIALIVNFTGNMILVPLLGSKGAAIATCLSFAMYLVFRIYFSNKYYYVDYKVKNMILMTTTLTIFSYVHTFQSLPIIVVLIYLINIIALFCIYKKDIKEMYDFALASFLKK